MSTTRTTTQEPNDSFEQLRNNSILYGSQSQRRVSSEPIDWSFKEIDISMSSDDSNDSSDWDQFKSMSKRMVTSTPQTKPTDCKTNQRKRSYIPQHLERTVLEWSPYSCPYTAVIKRQSINDRSYSTGINTTLFEDNSIHRSFRSTTTETNESLSELQMEIEFQSNSELMIEEEVVPKLPDLPNELEVETDFPSGVEGLVINGLEFITRDQLKQLNQKVFVSIDLKSEVELKSEHKSDTQRLRRSKRTRMQVMEYWRGERPIYKMGTNDFTEKVVGIYSGSEEELNQKKRTTKRKIENKCQKNVNVFDLSIHNKDIKISDNKDSINIKSLETLKWKKCPKSEGLDIAIITKNMQKGVAVGVIRIQGLRSKEHSLTGNYVSHLTVTLGVLLLVVEGKGQVRVKTGDNFTIDSNTKYFLSNLRKDFSYIHFIVLKN